MEVEVKKAIIIDDMDMDMVAVLELGAEVSMCLWDGLDLSKFQPIRSGERL